MSRPQPTSHGRRRSNRNRQSRKRRGYVMLLVMVIVLTSTAFAALHHRHLSAALRVEQARMRSEDYRSGPVTVLSIACHRLETGDPPAPVSYRHDHTVGATTTMYRIDYSLSGSQWTITADPDPTATALPVLPTTF